jgi:hypothetical protein
LGPRAAARASIRYFESGLEKWQQVVDIVMVHGHAPGHPGKLKLFHAGSAGLNLSLCRNNLLVDPFIFEESQNGISAMPRHNQISSLNNWALRWEIGERLRFNLAVDNPRLPASIENPLNRLRELEGESPARSFNPLHSWFKLDR